MKKHGDNFDSKVPWEVFRCQDNSYPTLKIKPVNINKNKEILGRAALMESGSGSKDPADFPDNIWRGDENILR
jgi:hypothetical protein